MSQHSARTSVSMEANFGSGSHLHFDLTSDLGLDDNDKDSGPSQSSSQDVFEDALDDGLPLPIGISVPGTPQSEPQSEPQPEPEPELVIHDDPTNYYEPSLVVDLSNYPDPPLFQSVPSWEKKGAKFFVIDFNPAEENPQYQRSAEVKDKFYDAICILGGTVVDELEPGVYVLAILAPRESTNNKCIQAYAKYSNFPIFRDDFIWDSFRNKRVPRLKNYELWPERGSFVPNTNIRTFLPITALSASRPPISKSSATFSPPITNTNANESDASFSDSGDEAQAPNDQPAAGTSKSADKRSGAVGRVSPISDLDDVTFGTSDESESDQENNANSRRAKTRGNAAKRQKMRGENITFADQQAMIDWIIKHRKYENIFGNNVFKEMEKAQVVPGRTWQGLNNNFRRYMVQPSKFRLFIMSPADRRKFQRVFDKSGSKYVHPD